MRPYLAIIKDSFREAIASRVLWVTLGLIVLLLLALAPLGYKQKLTTDFSWGDIQRAPALVTKLRNAGNSNKPSPGKRIWSLLEEKEREQLGQFERLAESDEGDFFRGLEVLRTALTRLVHKKDFYDEPSWKDVSLSKEARDYLARRDKLSDEEHARLNRLLIENVFSSHFRSRSAYSISIVYLWPISDPLPFTKDQVDTFIKEWMLSSLMSTVVGVFGIITAILVTSTIIPQMFDPGSITLLLSKPVSRSLLFVSKFLGGCAFIALNVSVLIVGLWLILGTRFGVWNYGILWCIPIFLFMFLIYYAVSALTGLIWKSPVVSVVMTVLFWVMCFSVGSIKQWVGGLLLDPQRITKIAEADGTLVTVNEVGIVRVWDEEKRDWRPVYEPRGGGGMPTIDGPYYHAETKQLLFGQGFRNPFGFVGQRISLRIGRASNGWEPRDGPPLPAGTATLLVENDGGVLAVASDNIFRLQGKPAPLSSPIRVFGVTLPIGRGAEFAPMVDETLNFEDPIAAAADPREGRLLVCSRNDVYLFGRQTDGKLKPLAKRRLTGNEKEGAAVAIAGQLALVAREDGKLWLLDADDLAIKKEFKLEHQTQPRFALASPDGTRIGVLFQNRRLWLVDTATGEARLARVTGQDDINGFVFSGDNLLVADHVSRVTSYDLATLRKEESRAPKMTRFEWVYYYGILPMYIIFPKPGELDNTVQYALTGKTTTDMGIFQGDLTQRREELHPWRPVASGLAFVAVVMLIACIYIERHEF